ncbi:hypothetical protein ACO0KY_11600 [Undibacterium sp. Dicai25W]|uniref:hypothetical protein n=1 Tax=Undibacterium sp. Dicai25W TaxID=3413034 RepID=UPI003BF3B8AB
MSLKPAFNFRLEGVSSREVALLTSYVRVLSYKLEHQWRHQDNDPHLVIYGYDESNVEKDHDKFHGSYQLFISSINKGEKYLRLPLNSSDIEYSLNRIGKLLEPVSEEKSTSAIDPNQRYRLRRWPQSHLLTTPDRVRLTTLMTKRAFSVNELHKYSGLAVNQCRLFVEDMLGNDLLVVSNIEVKKQQNSHQSSAEIQQATTRPNLISLIRSNLSRFATNGGQ